MIKLKVKYNWILLSILLGGFLFLKFNDSFHYKIQSIFKSNVRQIAKGNSLGTIYKINTFHFQKDSLIEYYWDGNYVLMGQTHFGVDDSLFLENANYILKSFRQSDIALTKIAWDNRELTLYSINYEKYNKIITFTYDFKNNEGLRIYGPEYTFDEAYRLAMVILFGKVYEYTIIAREELSNSKEYNE